MKYKEYRENLGIEQNPGHGTRVDPNIYKATIHEFILNFLEEEIPTLTTVNPVIQTEYFYTKLEDLRKKFKADDTDLDRSHADWLQKSTFVKGREYFKDFVNEVKKIVTPPAGVKIFKAQNKDLIGMKFQHQTQRELFIFLLKTNTNCFEKVTKQTIAKRFPEMFTTQNNRNQTCLIVYSQDSKGIVTDEVKRTLYIPAYHEKNWLGSNYYYAVFSSEVVRNLFCSLLKFPTTGEVIQEGQLFVRFQSNWLKSSSEIELRSLRSYSIFVTLEQDCKLVNDMINIVMSYAP